MKKKKVITSYTHSGLKSEKKCNVGKSQLLKSLFTFYLATTQIIYLLNYFSIFQPTVLYKICLLTSKGVAVMHAYWQYNILDRVFFDKFQKLLEYSVSFFMA